MRDLSEVILYLLLPESEFQTKALRYMLREIIALNVMLPMVNMVSDPDYINQTMALWISDESVCFDSIVDAIRTSRSLKELGIIADNINVDIKDKLSSGNSDKFKNQLDNLLSAQRECEHRRAVLSGTEQQSEQHPSANLPFHLFLLNNTALAYFSEVGPG